MRFVPPVAALTAATVEFHGDARASQRPVAPILAALRELGAVIDDGGRGAIPFAVRGTGSLAGGAVTLDASASSQFVSGLLLAAPRFDKGVEIRHRGRRVPSAPHIAMTVQMLRDAGAEVETASMHNDPAGPRGGHVAGSPGAGQGRDARRRARPVERRAVPGRRPGHRRHGDHPRLAAADHPAGRPHPGPPHPDGRPVRADRRRAAVSPAPARSTASTPTCSTCPSWRRSLAALAALADSPSRLTGIGAHPAARDRPAGRAGHRDQRARRECAEYRGRPGIRPRPLHGGVFAQLRRPPAGHGGRGARARRTRASRSRTSRPPRQDPARSSPSCGSAMLEGRRH